MESIKRKSQERAQVRVEAAEGAGVDHGTAGAAGTMPSRFSPSTAGAGPDATGAEATENTASQTSSVQGVRAAKTADGATAATGASLPGLGSAALARAMDLSDVRLEEVVRLRLAIASGRYRVSAADLADKMIASFRGGSVLRQFS